MLSLGVPSFVFGQIQGESQEIPRVTLFVNEIRDIPAQGFRNLIMTTSGVVDIENLPSGILRVRARTTGNTVVYIFDSTGRRTIQFEVTGATPNQTSSVRPGYDPAGSEFIYRTLMNNQYASGKWSSPFWIHEFSSSVPIQQTNEWRTLLRASTSPGRFNGDFEFSPFSSSTGFDQILSYYQTPSYNVAVGDVNYNPGELSIIGFPLRGGSVQLYGNQMRDQIQFFGGLSKPQIRSNQLFNDGDNQLFGVAGTKEIFKNVSLRSSLVYLDQPSTFSLYPNDTFQNEFVGDLGFVARPFSDEFTFEGEFARSRNDNAYRALLEYTPFWGRVMLSMKQVGSNYVKPARFSQLRNFRDSNVITDIKVNRQWGVLFNYQLFQTGDDPIQLAQKSNTHRASVGTLYQKTEETSYITSFEVSHTSTAVTPQNYQQLSWTYQHLNQQTKDQWFVQWFARHAKNFFLQDYMKRLGGGVDTRYTKNYSSVFQMYLQNGLQINQVKNTFPIFANDPNYIETVINLGPTVNYSPGNKTYSVGILDNINFQNMFGKAINVIQPFASLYWNPSQALSLGSRLNYNVDFASNYQFLSILGELVYKFGTRVPDTLRSTFSSTAKISGHVFIDSNDDGKYQVGEKLIDSIGVIHNGKPSKPFPTGTFELQTSSGPSSIMIELPPNYQNFLFGTANPAQVNIFAGETRTLDFPISQKIALRGKVLVASKAGTKGFDGARIEISGEYYKNTITTLASGVFNVELPSDGSYTVALVEMELPAGYKNSSPSKYEINVVQGKINEVPDFTLYGKRSIIGRAFTDTNQNNVFDDKDIPIPGVQIKIGKHSLKTEQDGSFAFNSIEPGTYDVQVGTRLFKGAKLDPFKDRLFVPEVGTIELVITYTQ